MSGPTLSLGAQQTFKPLTNRAVAFAGSGLKAAAVEDGDQPAGIADEACSLQDSRGDGNARAVHAQHHGDEFLGERHFIILDPVMSHQQPSSKALLQSVPSVTGCRL